MIRACEVEKGVFPFEAVLSRGSSFNEVGKGVDINDIVGVIYSSLLFVSTNISYSRR